MRGTVPVKGSRQSGSFAEHVEIGIDCFLGHVVVRKPSTQSPCPVLKQQPLGIRVLKRLVMPRPIRLVFGFLKGAAKSKWMRPRQDRQGHQPLGRRGGDQPTDRAAPVVTHEMKPFGVQRVRHAEHVGHQMVDMIGLDLLGPRARRVTPLIGRDRAKPRAAKGRDLVVPRIRSLRITVQQQNQAAVVRSGSVDIEGQSPDLQSDLIGHPILPRSMP